MMLKLIRIEKSKLKIMENQTQNDDEDAFFSLRTLRPQQKLSLRLKMGRAFLYLCI